MKEKEAKYYSLLGSKIKQVRKLENISLTKLAKWINVSRQTLTDYESGSIKTPAHVLEDIIDALNLPSCTFNDIKNKSTVTEYNDISDLPTLIKDISNEIQKRVLHPLQKFHNLIETKESDDSIICDVCFGEIKDDKIVEKNKLVSNDDDDNPIVA